MVEENNNSFVFNKNEVEKYFTRGTGNGGQNRNKRETVCVLTHIPTGITVSVQDERYQFKNEQIAWKRLEEKLKAIYNKNNIQELKDNIFDQIGYGKRGNKIRTYNEKMDNVLDHNTNKNITFKELYKGKIKKLH